MLIKYASLVILHVSIKYLFIALVIWLARMLIWNASVN